MIVVRIAKLSQCLVPTNQYSDSSKRKSAHTSRVFIQEKTYTVCNMDSYAMTTLLQKCNKTLLSTSLNYTYSHPIPENVSSRFKKWRTKSDSNNCAEWRIVLPDNSPQKLRWAVFYFINPAMLRSLLAIRRLILAKRSKPMVRIYTRWKCNVCIFTKNRFVLRKLDNTQVLKSRPSVSLRKKQ